MDQQELRDDQWAVIEPFVSGGREGRRGGPRSNGRTWRPLKTMHFVV